MTRYIHTRLEANTLPTVIVVAMLMTLTVLALMGTWEMESLLFSRTGFMKARRADIESAFILYSRHPNIMGDSAALSVRLYDSVETSTVRIERSPWGLYEAVSVISSAADISRTGILGAARHEADSLTLYYPDTGSSLTLTGNSNIQGLMEIPRNGIIYGQMRSEFFEGTRIEQQNIRLSEKELPEPCSSALLEISALLSHLEHEHPPLDADSVSVSFRNAETSIYAAAENILWQCSLSGKAIIVADELYIDATAALSDILVVGRNITVGENFRGTVQIFATDTVYVERSAVLEYPSGIYCVNYAELEENAVVNGYVVVSAEDQSDIMKPNYRQDRLAKVRGLLYIDGNAQVQGIVSGLAYLNKSVYYSPQGYYKDMLYDASLLENNEMGMPLWLDNKTKRKNIKWVR